MKVALESTTKIVSVNGVEARVWQGQTSGGVPCYALVTLIFADRQADQREFELELEPQAVPRPEVQAFPARMVL